MKYRAIRAHSRRYPSRLMCRACAVSPAGYYGWRDRPESRHPHPALGNPSDPPRFPRNLQQSQHLRRPDEAGAWCRRKPHRTAHACRRDPGQDREAVARHNQLSAYGPVAPNTLNRQFQVEQPNRVWAGDLTYI